MKRLFVILWSITGVANGATLNITSAPYNGVGDCRDIYVNVTNASAVISSTNSFVAGDVGKIVQIFAGGAKSTLLGPGGGGYFNGNYHSTPTNQQDLVATIVSVAGTTATLNRICGVSTNQIRMTFGTLNNVALTNVINAAASNDVIYFPAGRYLLMPSSAIDTNFVQDDIFDGPPTIGLYKGGLTFQGDGTNDSVIVGVGAWQQKGLDSAFRGPLFFLGVAPTNNGPLVFRDLQFDGNATRLRGPFTSFPAIPTDGSGWDPTHHVLTDGVPSGQDYFITFTNCLITRWHGETIQGISVGNGHLTIANCTFVDGNSTVINFNSAQDIVGNFVTDYYQFAEDGQFTVATSPAYIRGNILTNIYGGTVIALVGATIGVAHAGYIISNNVISGVGYCITTARFKNLSILNNRFYDGSIGIGIGVAGGQGDDINHDMVILGNTFTNMQVAVGLFGSGDNGINRVDIRDNSADVSIYFAYAGTGSGTTPTNVWLSGNVSDLGVNSVDSAAQWMLVKSDNAFPATTYTIGASTTNTASYALGYLHRIDTSTASSGLLLSNNASIPPRAQMLITNASAATTKIYVNSVLNTNLAAGDAFVSHWDYIRQQWDLVPYSHIRGDLNVGGNVLLGQ